MARLSALSALLTFGLLFFASQAAAQNVKIMPFGASIVSRCWRANLQAKLRNSGIWNFDFVGTQTGKCGIGGVTGLDQDHEGHPGSLATDFAKNGNLTGWLDKNSPDIVIMLLGTNDVLVGKKPVNEVLAAYDTLLAQMRNKNSKMQIIFSNLLPLDPARWDPNAVTGIKALNAAIATYAPKKSTASSPVYFVDNFAGFDPVADTDDGEHPNLPGNEKMAKKFIDPTKTAISAVVQSRKAKAKRISMAERRAVVQKMLGT